MIRLDFNKKLKILKGDDVSKDPPLLNNLLSFVLTRSQNASDPVKLWGWAVKLSNDGIIDIDKSDADFLRDVIKNDPGLFVNAKAQMIEIIEDGKSNKRR